jgi:hypothetical protein
MKKLPTLIAVTSLTLLSMLSGCASQQKAPLFVARAKDQGVAYDMVITETRRETSKSWVEVTGFIHRDRAATHWMTCTFNALAAARGFRYWAAEYPLPGKENIVLGFTSADGVTAHDVLGDDYVKARNLDGGMETVDKIAPTCKKQ